MNLPEVSATLSTVGWKGNIAPAIHKRLQDALLQLASANRPKEVSDDMLRGHIAALSWVLEFPERVNRAIKALEDGDKEPPKEPEGAGSPHEAELEN